MKRMRVTPFLILAALVALNLVPAPDAVAQDADATSPSQEAGARLRAVRANEFFYQSYGKSDPFYSLVNGRYEQSNSGELVDVNSARLVGVMWGDDDQFALV